MSVSIKASECAQIRELFTLFSKKGAFVLDEYVAVGTVFSALTELIKDIKEPETLVSMDKEKASFIYNTMTVCTQRTPVEVQNYKAIGYLFDLLADLLKEDAEEESKSNK